MPRVLGRSVALAAVVCTVWRAGEAAAQASAASPRDAERMVAEGSSASGAAKAVTAALHPQAVLVWPGAPVAVGADATRLLAAQSALDSFRLTLQPLALELSADSALAASWGLAIATPRAGAGAPKTGRYIGIWARETGPWRLTAILLSGLLPPPAGAVAAASSTRKPPLSSRGPAGPFATADLQFSKLAGDSGAGIAFERFAAPDAFLLDGQGLLVRGPKAIGALVTGPASWKWHPVAGGASASGDLGWTVGEAVIVPPAGEGAPAYSKYLTVWRRLADGSIRFLTDGGNPRPGP
jgi:ketosteroid isomerase-like protein